MAALTHRGLIATRSDARVANGEDNRSRFTDSPRNRVSEKIASGEPKERWIEHRASRFLSRSRRRLGSSISPSSPGRRSAINQTVAGTRERVQFANERTPAIRRPCKSELMDRSRSIDRVRFARFRFHARKRSFRYAKASKSPNASANGSTF